MSIRLRPDADTRKRIELALAAIAVSKGGTPAAKLPECPGCGHDELWAWRSHERRYGFSCYLCTYELRFESDPERQEERA